MTSYEEDRKSEVACNSIIDRAFAGLIRATSLALVIGTATGFIAVLVNKL